uniref:sulfatase-like hydrolase/transferase n=1 Tax=Pararhizobium sp. IMCC3301 TaxID=3067904 RepID=UPI00274174E1|nr:sulfatase-like hydrolase/transferase [Pararhizobium sp. IMCC3301]
MKPENFLIIMVDEMAAKAVGCFGHPTVKTPNIDLLASRGVTFTNAYATSPICIPARAAMATGQYPHKTGYWDNVFAYDGRVKSWGHRLQENGHRFTTIGKLHFEDENLPTGIDEQILPMHVFGGGDIFGLERENPPERPQSGTLAAEIRAGDSGYTIYDRKITTLTQDWFRNKADHQGSKPWVLFTSFIAPHFPLTVPQKYLDLYRDADIQLLGKSLDMDGPLAGWWRKFRSGYNFDDYFENDDHRRQALLHYFALCSFADENVGQVIEALDQSGQADHTRILFLADHGDNMGARGLWGKSTMHEESANVPMILVGSGIPAGTICDTPVSLVDVFPTVLDAVGVEASGEDQELPGTSLFDIAAAPYDNTRQVFCEYHGSCAPTGLMMLRKGRYKFVFYTDYGVELFDLEEDPEEISNLASDASHAGIVAEFQSALARLVDPDATDAHAKRDQRKRLAELGGMDAIIAQGGVPHTPAPGETPSFIGS